MNLLLLFDFDGVIADSLAVFHEGMAAVCRRHGFPQFEDRERFLDLFDVNMVTGLRQLGVPPETVPAILGDLGGMLVGASDRYQPFPGIVDAFRHLTAVAPVYVITSNLTAVVEAWLERYGVAGVRDVLGADKESSKRVKIRRVAAQWPALQPVYIGDTLGDMEEAHAAGALAVAAGWGWHDEARLRRGLPNRFLASPSELPGLAGLERGRIV